MWEDYEEARVGSPYVWVAFILLLLFLSSIFLFRPTIVPRPTEEPASPTGRLVATTLDEDQSGQPLFIKATANGAWIVHAKAAEAGQLVRFINERGNEQWSDTAAFTDLVIRAEGNFLVLAGVGQSRVFVYHTRHKLVSSLTIPGEVQNATVNEQGQVLVSFTMAANDPLSLRTEVAQFSSLGQQMWRQSLHDELPLFLDKSADGQVSAVVNVTLGDRVGAMLTVFGRHGETLFRTEVEGQPKQLLVRRDGERIIVGGSNGVTAFSKAGERQFAYASTGGVSSLSFLGLGPELLFSRQVRSVFNLRKQYTVGVLRDDGELFWQDDIAERVVCVSTASETNDILIGTALQLFVYNSEGQVMYNVTHPFGADYLATIQDGTHSLLVNSLGQVVELRGE